MDDLELIESKAHAWAEESEDVKTLRAATHSLRDVAEQRKIRADVASAGYDAERDAAERKSEGIRFWTATLMPTLAFVVTAGTFLFQIYQLKITAQEQEDSQWRLALEKIATDSKVAHVGALEMESFFRSQRYANVSRPVAASLLAAIDDTSIFDLIFTDFWNKTIEPNQSIAASQSQELAIVARALTSRLRGRYEVRKNVFDKDKDCRDRTLLRLLVGVLKPLLVLYFARSRDNAADESGRLVVRDAQGRQVTPNDLPEGTGTLDWAIVDNEHIPRRAQELHELGRQAGAAWRL